MLAICQKSPLAVLFLHRNTLKHLNFNRLHRLPADVEHEQCRPASRAHKLSKWPVFTNLTDGPNRAMYNLCRLSKDAYFRVSTKGSNSIKKVLPAVMATSPLLREAYSQATYGSPGGIASKNYSGFTWWRPDDHGNPQDPYSLLKSYGEDLLGETLLASEDPDDLVVAEGGAATTAYARLQFETLIPDTRANINEALLRYCELDTLAMVMIVQAWRDFLETPL